MTEILCSWLNNDIHLTRHIDPQNLPSEFSNGYLIGELLNKFELQRNFSQFKNGRDNKSKLDNFLLIEPTVQLLGIKFNVNHANQIIRQVSGAANKLLYELYIALKRKEKSNLSAVAMGTMMATGPARLNELDSLTYQTRLHQLVPRESQEKLEALQNRFDQTSKEQANALSSKIEKEGQQIEEMQEKRRQLIIKHRQEQAKKTELSLRSLQSNPTKTVKPLKPEFDSIEKKRKRLQAEVDETRKDIDLFENKLKPIKGPMQRAKSKMKEDLELHHSISNDENFKLRRTATNYCEAETNQEYINKIRNKLNEEASAREEREKRRRRVLMKQMQAHQLREDMIREEVIAEKLMKRSQFEKRIAVQLEQARREKQIIIENRVEREKQYQEQREQEYNAAILRNQEISRQNELLRTNEILAQRELHQKLYRERKQRKEEARSKLCSETVNEIVNFSLKIVQHKRDSNRDPSDDEISGWKKLFYSNFPLFNEKQETEELENKEQNCILDEAHLKQYMEKEGTWKEVEVFEDRVTKNIVHNLLLKKFPDKKSPSPIKLTSHLAIVSIVGKCFSGKSSAIKLLKEDNRFKVFSPEILIEDAVKAHREGELEEKEIIFLNEIERKSTSVEDPESAKNTQQEHVSTEGHKAEENSLHAESKEIYSDTDAADDDDATAELTDHDMEPQSVFVPSQRALLGEQALAMLRHGQEVDSMVVAEILADAISRVEEEDLIWILDSFPSSQEQTKCLELALAGRLPDPEMDCTMQENLKNKSSALFPYYIDTSDWPRNSVIDLVVLLHIDDHEAITRAAVVGSPDIMADVAVLREKNLQLRLNNFDEMWSTFLSEYFHRHSSVQVVDSSESIEITSLNIRELIESFLAQREEGTRKQLEEKEKLLAEEEAKRIDDEAEKEKAELEKLKEINESKENLNESKGKGRGRKQISPDRKKAKTPTTSEEMEKVLVVAAKPGDIDWEGSELQPSEEMNDVLIKYWQQIENNYTEDVKMSLSTLRKLKSSQTDHISRIRKEFHEFLRKPDESQQVIDEFQSNFNEMNLREDVEKKMELHQQTEELKEKLWEMSDEKKTAVENLKQELIGSNWASDTSGLIINCYLRLLQTEVNKYQDVSTMLQIYLQSLNDDQIPDELPSGLARIPLIQLSAIESEMESRLSSAKSSSTVDGTKSIPLRVRREINESGSRAARKRKEEESPMDADARILRESLDLATQTVERHATAVKNEYLAAKEAERLRILQEEKAAEKAKKLTEKEKKRSPSPKKKTLSKEESELNLDAKLNDKNKINLDKAQQEHQAAIQNQALECQNRLKAIYSVAVASMNDLNIQLKATEEEMNEQTGQQFQEEMDRVVILCRVVKEAIEDSSPITFFIGINGSSLHFNQKNETRDFCQEMLRSCSSDSLQPFNFFTFTQIKKLYEMMNHCLHEVLIPLDSLTDVLTDILQFNPQIFPDIWIEFTKPQVIEFCENLSNDQENLDWRVFLINLAGEWPEISQENLEDLLNSFLMTDEHETGYLSIEQFATVHIWENETENEDLLKFKNLFFEVLQENGKLPYWRLLMYLSCHSDGATGLERAILIMSQYHMRLYRMESSNEHPVGFSKAEKIIPLTTLYQILHNERPDSVLECSRQSFLQNQDDEYSMDHLRGIYEALGQSDPEFCPWELLLQHHLMQEILATNKRFQLKRATPLLLTN